MADLGGGWNGKCLDVNGHSSAGGESLLPLAARGKGCACRARRCAARVPFLSALRSLSGLGWGAPVSAQDSAPSSPFLTWSHVPPALAPFPQTHQRRMQKVISLRQLAGVDASKTAKSSGRVMSMGALASLHEEIPDQIAATVEALISGPDSKARAAAAIELGQHDVGLLIQHRVFDALKVAIVDKTPEHREGAMLGVAGLCETRFETAGHPCEPYLVNLLPLLLDAMADTKEPVRLAAEKAARTLIEITSPHAMGVVLPALFEAMTDIKKKWQTRRGGIVLLGALAHRAPAAIAESVPAIIPVISECMRDVRKEVVTTAEEVRGGAGRVLRHACVRASLWHVLCCRSCSPSPPSSATATLSPSSRRSSLRSRAPRRSPSASTSCQRRPSCSR